MVKEVAIHKNPELDSTVHSSSLEFQNLILKDMLQISYYSEFDVLFHPGNLKLQCIISVYQKIH